MVSFIVGLLAGIFIGFISTVIIAIKGEIWIIKNKHKN